MFLTGWARSAGLRVAIMRTADATPLVAEATTRLGAVLLAAGFDIVEVDARTDDDAHAALEHAGRGTRLFAVLWLQSVADGAAIDVVISEAARQGSPISKPARQGSPISKPARQGSPISKPARQGSPIADSTTQKRSVRRVTVTRPSGEPSRASSRDIALQGLDLLRASLLEVDAAPRVDEAFNDVAARDLRSERRAPLASKSVG